MKKKKLNSDGGFETLLHNNSFSAGDIYIMEFVKQTIPLRYFDRGLARSFKSQNNINSSMDYGCINVVSL